MEGRWRRFGSVAGRGLHELRPRPPLWAERGRNVEARPPEHWENGELKHVEESRWKDTHTYNTVGRYCWASS